MQGTLEDDLAALRKLRDDDESGALKALFGDGEDPREWTYKNFLGSDTKAVTVADGRVTELYLIECTKLTVLPAAIGGLAALTKLHLHECSSLATLPDSIGKLGALTELALSECSSLAELPEAIGGLKALTKLILNSCKSRVALPAAIGELKALTELTLRKCSSLAALPDAIGELGALTKLDLNGCSSLGALPDTIGKLDALTTINLNKCTSLTELPAAIGELGALRELDLNGCSKLKRLPDAIGELKALTELWLNECSSLSELPAAIGRLSELTKLGLRECSSLIALPESIGGLDTLRNLNLNGCSKLTFPPPHIRRVEQIKRLLANTTRLLAGEISAENVDGEAKTDFLEVINHAHFADRLEEAVGKDQALADLTNDKGERAIELACLECRRTMQKALFLLGRYDVDKTPPLHFSATAAVLSATDYDADPKQRRALKAMRRADQVVAELRGRAGLNDNYVVAVKAVHVGSTVGDDAFAEVESAATELGLVIDKNADLGGLSGLLAQRSRGDDVTKARDAAGTARRFEGYDYLIVLELADMSLNHAIVHGGIAGRDFHEVRGIADDIVKALSHLHEERRIHADVKPLNIVRVGLSWQLIDLDVSCAIGCEFGAKRPSSGYCPPEMARVIVDATDAKGTLDATKLQLYVADVAYDLWSLGVVLFHLVTGAALWNNNQNDDISSASDLRQLAKTWSENKARLRLDEVVPSPSRDQTTAFDLIVKLLDPDPAARKAHFAAGREMASVCEHLFFSAAGSHDARLDELLAGQKRADAKLAELKKQNDLILELSMQHRDELRQSHDVLIKAIFDATEVSTPTAFFVLKEKLPPAGAENKARAELTLKEDGTGVVLEGAGVDDAKDRYEEAKTWLNIFADFGRGVAKLSASSISDAVQKGCSKLVVKDEAWVYLIDELTGEPVVLETDGDEKPLYPIRITKPAEIVSKLLPVMQVGLHAASLVNGVAGVVRLFGYPFPKVPEAWRKGAQNSVEILKQESSVEQFAAVHEKVQEGDEATETTRGGALRDLEAFFAEHDKERSYAGLRRIGDPSDGTAVWTLLTDPAKVKEALEARAQERREEARRRDKHMKDLMAKAAGDDCADAGSVSADAGGSDDTGAAGDTGAAAATTPTTPTAAAGGGTAAARALSSPRRETADSLRRVEDRLASIEDRLQGLGNWFY